jgi:ABC-2 type transport system ATP-binding protein
MQFPAIRADHLTKRYGDALAVNGVSFEIASGSITGLLGGNGAGKTTTIGMIMGLVAPTAGRVLVFGADMAREPYRALHRMNLESPYVDLPHRLTVRQNLTVFGMLYGVRGIGERIARLARELDLVEFLDRPAGKLSAGQKTRVALAKALVNEPDLLVLDEPTASLDPDVAHRVRNGLLELSAQYGTALLMTSHDMSDVERVCERVIFLAHGTIVANGTPAEIARQFGHGNLEGVFLHLAEHHDVNATQQTDHP